MHTATLVALGLLAAVAVPTATADPPQQGLPPDTNCPLGYNWDAVLNVCTYPQPAPDVGYQCLYVIGDMNPPGQCVPIPYAGESTHTDFMYGGFYVEAVCNLGDFGIQCGCWRHGVAVTVETYVCAPILRDAS